MNISSRAGSIKSIALLRGVAVLLVLWDHSVARWTNPRGRTWFPLDAVQDWTAEPLVIIQDFGFLGVCIFFLVSGFIISEVAVRESRRDFLVKRFFRIYPALIASILLIVAIGSMRDWLGISGVSYTTPQVLWSMTLLNYITGATKAVNGVAWSLVIEVIFYVLVLVCIGLLKRRFVLAIFVELGFVMLVVASAKSFPIDRFNSKWFLFAASVAYLPLLVLGQVLWLWRKNSHRLRVIALSGLACWLAFVFGMRRIHTKFLVPENAYGPSIAIALTIVCVALVNENRIRIPRAIAVISVVSYSIYLIHGPVTDLVLTKFVPHAPYAISLILALIVLAIFSFLLWRFVELPSQAIARKLARPADKNQPRGLSLP